MTHSGKPGFARRRIDAMLAGSGVEIDGPNPWDPQVGNPAFFRRVLVNGSLGLGESYVDGWWDCARLDEMYNRLLRSPRIADRAFIAYALPYARALFANLQTRARAFKVGEAHYDLGNDLYRAMLDRRMVYTCGYWRDADNLDDAQLHKLELACRKLDLRAGMRVLDIGCGWGGFAKHAAKHHGVEVVGVTVSKEQVELGRELCRGLPVELRLQDYRDVAERFDAIVSLGMFEHVGHKNYRTYMRCARDCLRPRGKFLLHTIGKNHSRAGVDPWIAKHIFPNGEIPSLRQISAACEEMLIIEDVHNFGADYDHTLMAWFDNFDRAWPQLRANLPQRFHRRFHRIWKYYLHVCAGAFRARNLQLWQIVLSAGDAEGAYRRPDL
ncbi:MAG: cyclopropane fatty acyl phospholipid synthase [bacterium]